MAEFIVHKYIVYISVPFRTQFMCERRDKLQPLRYNSKGLIILTAAFGLVIWAGVTWLSFVVSRCSRREREKVGGVMVEWEESLTVPLHGSVSPGCVQSVQQLRGSEEAHSLTHLPVSRILYGPARSPVTRSGAVNRPVLRWVKRTMNNVCIKWSQLTQTPAELALKEAHAGSATVKVRSLSDFLLRDD